MIIEIDIEKNSNVDEYEQRTYRGGGLSYDIGKTLYYDDQANALRGSLAEPRLVEVVGWHNQQEICAKAIHVQDSGDGDAWLIYGGNQGIRLRFADPNNNNDGSNLIRPFALEHQDEWGELYLYYHQSLFDTAIKPFLKEV